MTPFKIIGGISACILMACGSIPKPTAIAHAPSVGPDNPDANTTVETALNPPTVVSSDIDQPEPTFVNLPAAAPPALAEQMLAESNRLAGTYRTLDQSLCQAAQDYADYLARTRQQGHFADGDPEQRAKRAGFTGSLRMPGKRLSSTETSYGLGEVLAFGHHNPDAAFFGWMNSPGHKEALLERTFDVAGFGQNGTIRVGMFGNTQVPAVAAPKLVAAAQYTEPQGRWATSDEPIYGPFGRQRGTRKVTRWQGAPMQAPQQKPMQSFGACGPGGCGGRGILGRR